MPVTDISFDRELSNDNRMETHFGCLWYLSETGVSSPPPPKCQRRDLASYPERLFRTVYVLEKGAAFRLGRSSNIRDTEIALPSNPSEPRSIKLGSVDERCDVAETFAAD